MWRYAQAIARNGSGEDWNRCRHEVAQCALIETDLFPTRQLDVHLVFVFQSPSFGFLGAKNAEYAVDLSLH